MVELLAFLIALALLVSNAAAGLASGLARSLAFAATTVFSALTKIARFNRFDMLHDRSLHYQ